MKNIDKDFENAHGRAVLFLGKIRSFNRDEIDIFLDIYDMHFTNTLDSDVAIVIEGSVMSPLEDELSALAYEQKIPFYPNDRFEQLYAKSLNESSLLMSLKLSNNQERLHRILKNKHLDNMLFLKLLRMHNWGDDGLFESSINMEVSTLFAKRFYKVGGYDDGVFHSTLSLYDIAKTHQDDAVLEALFYMPDISIKKDNTQRPRSIKQALGANTAINDTTKTKLLRLKDNEIDFFLAKSNTLNSDDLNTIYTRATDKTKEAIASNTNIDDTLFFKLLEEKNIQTLLTVQPITQARFEAIDKMFYPILATNTTLENNFVEVLLHTSQEAIHLALATNPSIETSYIDALYIDADEALKHALAQNPNLSTPYLLALSQLNTQKINEALAQNPSTPAEVLTKLYQKDDISLNKHLATNPALDGEYLAYFQLDSRLVPYLKQNPTFERSVAKRFSR